MGLSQEEILCAREESNLHLMVQQFAFFVHLERIELSSPVPKTGTLSVELQMQIGYLAINSVR